MFNSVLQAPVNVLYPNLAPVMYIGTARRQVAAVISPYFTSADAIYL